MAKDSTTPPASAPALLDKAIALGKGRSVKEVYFMDFGSYYYFDKSGQLINPWATGQYVDPTTMSDYDHKEIIPLQAGKVQDLPVWDKDLLKVMVEREEFARIEAQGQIDGWIAEGLESHDLIAKVKEAGGLITLADVGLA